MTQTTSSSPTVGRIVDAALHVFVEKGYEGASIREIMNRAEVTQPVIYYHFGNKKDLYKAVVERTMAAFFDDMDRALAGVDAPLDRLDTILLHHFRFQRNYRERSIFAYGAFFGLPRIVESERLLNLGLKIVALAAAEIKGLQDEGLLEEVDPEFMALNVVGAFNIFKMRNMYEPDFELSDERGRAIIKGFLKGWATPKGLSYFQEHKFNSNGIES